MIFETRNLSYNLRSKTDFIRTSVNTFNFGLNSLEYLVTKIWEILPYDIKLVGNLYNLYIYIYIYIIYIDYIYIYIYRYIY